MYMCTYKKVGRGLMTMGKRESLRPNQLRTTGLDVWSDNVAGTECSLFLKVL